MKNVVLPDQAVMLDFDHVVTLATALFQNLPVDDLDVAALVADRALILQTAGDETDGFTLDAQHMRDELVRHLQFIRPRAVMRHQHPAAEPLFGGVQAIADGGL